MIKGPKLSPNQWKLLSSAFSNIGQAIILFSLVTFFVPEAVGLTKEYFIVNSLGFLFWGLLFIYVATIMVRRMK